MKTISIGDHRLDELPNGDVEVVITRRTPRHIGASEPLDDQKLTIPKRDRCRVAEFLVGGTINPQQLS